jgi:hypothetical protein
LKIRIGQGSEFDPGDHSYSPALPASLAAGQSAVRTTGEITITDPAFCNMTGWKDNVSVRGQYDGWSQTLYDPAYFRVACPCMTVEKDVRRYDAANATWLGWVNANDAASSPHRGTG